MYLPIPITDQSIKYHVFYNESKSKKFTKKYFIFFAAACVPYVLYFLFFMWYSGDNKC